jgi:hypothetical protein
MNAFTQGKTDKSGPYLKFTNTLNLHNNLKSSIAWFKFLPLTPSIKKL